MKQNITTEQFQELSQENQKKLFEFFFYGLIGHPMRCTKNVWYGPVDINPEYITIGKMIEFLKKRAMGDLDLQIWENNSGSSVWTGIGKPKDKLGGGEDVELCDALWEAVKENLEAHAEEQQIYT